MRLSKSELIEMLEKRYGDADHFELEFEMLPPEPDYALIGCKYGSAEYMLRMPERKHAKEKINITASRQYT